MPQQIFEQDLDRERQPRDIACTGFFQLCQPEDLIRCITHTQRRRGAERIFAGHIHSNSTGRAGMPG
jgi:hypothetical protein